MQFSVVTHSASHAAPHVSGQRSINAIKQRRNPRGRLASLAVQVRHETLHQGMDECAQECLLIHGEISPTKATLRKFTQDHSNTKKTHHMFKPFVHNACSSGGCGLVKQINVNIISHVQHLCHDAEKNRTVGWMSPRTQISDTFVNPREQVLEGCRCSLGVAEIEPQIC